MTHVRTILSHENRHVARDQLFVIEMLTKQTHSHDDDFVSVIRLIELHSSVSRMEIPCHGSHLNLILSAEHYRLIDSTNKNLSFNNFLGGIFFCSYC